MERPAVTEVEGVVREVLADGRVIVEIAQNRCIKAEFSVRMKVRLIKVQPGDRVRCEISPYELDKARVVHCNTIAE